MNLCFRKISQVSFNPNDAVNFTSKTLVLAITILTLFYVTHIHIFASDTSTLSRDKSLFIYRTFRYHSLESVFSVVIMIHFYFKYSNRYSISFYAFFKRWLLPSLLFDCILCLSDFINETTLINLKKQSGMFPSPLKILAFIECLPIIL